MPIRSIWFLILISLVGILPITLVQGLLGRTIENHEEVVVGGDLMNKKEKLSHLQLYWHDVVTGPNPTSIRVVNPVPLSSPTGFGLINMIDNPLTVGPLISSTMVGRAQGFYASASQKELGLLMAMNFGFTQGKYKGSTFTVMGRNMVFTISKVREMPVIGGSGLFRFARGYVEARTHTVNNTGDAIVRYDCYVLHY